MNKMRFWNKILLWIGIVAVIWILETYLGLFLFFIINAIFFVSGFLIMWLRRSAIAKIGGFAWLVIGILGFLGRAAPVIPVISDIGASTFLAPGEPIRYVIIGFFTLFVVFSKSRGD